jgi:hypothetical protein
MAEQLTGVLREVLATADGVPRPAFSSLFSPEVQAVGTELVWGDGPTRLRQGGSTPPDPPGGPPDQREPARPPVPPGEIIAGGPILGCEPNARAVRFGLERSYPALARLTPDEARRVELVYMTNAIRPRTLT